MRHAWDPHSVFRNYMYFFASDINLLYINLTWEKPCGNHEHLKMALHAFLSCTVNSGIGEWDMFDTFYHIRFLIDTMTEQHFLKWLSLSLFCPGLFVLYVSSIEEYST